jgi:hypothetical protein
MLDPLLVHFIVFEEANSVYITRVKALPNSRLYTP